MQTQEWAPTNTPVHKEPLTLQGGDSCAPWAPLPYRPRQTLASTTARSWKVTFNLPHYLLTATLPPARRQKQTWCSRSAATSTHTAHSAGMQEGHAPPQPAWGQAAGRAAPACAEQEPQNRESCSCCEAWAPTTQPASSTAKAKARSKRLWASLLCNQHEQLCCHIQNPTGFQGKAAAGTRTRGDETFVSFSAADGHCRGCGVPAAEPHKLTLKSQLLFEEVKA